MARKNEVITFSRDGELQTDLLIDFAKQKRKLCHYTTFFCILNSRSLPNLKEMYMTVFRNKCIHNSITQSKTSEMGANGGNIPHLQAIITSHTVCTFKMMYSTMHAAALHQLWIYDSLIVGLRSTALIQYLKCQD